MPVRAADLARSVSGRPLTPSPPHLLGAHVSAAGGVDRAPGRGREVGATAIQLFTKTPSQWREPTLRSETVAAFREALDRYRIRIALSHDSYPINLASPDRTLQRRSVASFHAELARCRALEIPYVVTHPGNFMTNRQRGLVRNAKAYGDALEDVDGPTMLIETTAGAGTALGSHFEELAELRDRIPSSVRGRVGFCADACHLFAAGYDLENDWEAV